jgi:hypothetical protein
VWTAYATRVARRFATLHNSQGNPKCILENETFDQRIFNLFISPSTTQYTQQNTEQKYSIFVKKAQYNKVQSKNHVQKVDKNSI